MTVATYDCALLLVNSVYEIGLRPQACNNLTVCDNDRVDSRVRTALRHLEKAVSDSRALRNKMVHRVEEPPLGQTLTLLLASETIERLTNFSEDPLVSHVMFRPPLRNDFIRMEVRDMERDLRTGLSAVAVAFRALMVALHPAYRSHFVRHQFDEQLAARTKKDSPTS